MAFRPGSPGHGSGVVVLWGRWSFPAFLHRFAVPCRRRPGRRGGTPPSAHAHGRERPECPDPARVSFRGGAWVPRPAPPRSQGCGRAVRRYFLVPELLISREKGSMRDAGQTVSREVVFASDTGEARRIQDEIERLLQAHQFGEREIFGIKLALEEALVNAIKHGNRLDQTKKVSVTYTVNTERFDIVIGDEGKGFDPEDVPDPVAVENLERPCGRGLLLM